MTTPSDIGEIYRQLFESHYVQLRNHAKRFVDSDDEADDVVEDVFVELWQNRERLDFGSGILNYLYRATSARALNVLRHKGVAALRIDLLESINAARLDYLATSDDTQPLERRELHDQIEQAISALPEKCREVFKLSYIHGLRNQDIADVMDVSVRTVEAHMYKALRLLRERLRYLLLFSAFFSLFYN